MFEEKRKIEIKLKENLNVTYKTATETIHSVYVTNAVSNSVVFYLMTYLIVLWKI